MPAGESRTTTSEDAARGGRSVVEAVGTERVSVMRVFSAHFGGGASNDPASPGNTTGDS